MNYIYTAIYVFEGIASVKLEKDILLYQDNRTGITATLTKDINHHCLILDKYLAFKSIVIFGKQANLKEAKISVAVDNEIKKIQGERQPLEETSVGMAITIKGETELTIEEHQYVETEYFRLLEKNEKLDSLKKRNEEQVNALLASLSIAIGLNKRVHKVKSVYNFTDSSNKPLYFARLEAHPPRVVTARSIDTRIENEIAQLMKIMSRNKTEFKTPLRLYMESLESNDELRKFIAAWTALEIMTNKMFKYYEDRVFHKLQPGEARDFASFIRNMMKDKYRLADKFSLIAAFLVDDSATDIQLFKGLKKVRDKILHGEEIQDKDLPTDEIRKMFASYLKKHLFELIAGL